jgi:hypothetical protein
VPHADVPEAIDDSLVVEDAIGEDQCVNESGIGGGLHEIGRGERHDPS